MIPRWLSLSAAAALVPDGATLALGGMTVYRRPMAFTRALLRREPRPRDLTLLAFTAGLECDLLVGAGCVRAVRSCYFGLESFGFAPMFTEAAQRGSVHVIEETEASLSLGIRAGLSKTPHLPSPVWVGTDLPRLRPDVQTITDPFTGEPLTAFPAIACDVAVLHALEADDEGACLINRNAGVDLELVYLADLVIVTAERRVARCVPTADGLLIARTGADVLALAPRGAWPTSCYPLYPLAGGEFLRYVDACNAGRFEDYLASALQADADPPATA